ncbi:WXG100 family type VII secretion target [Nocardia sp. NPDC057663]|uniref:WXG100 family type VII secretion target n=1 Tax=Nocardia sp. NPDC057663 TaxID=3346201 RepID=UPI003671AC11
MGLDSVQEFGRLVYRTAEELRSGATTVDHDVAGLMNSWRGAAADAYNDEWDQLGRGASQVWDAMFTLAEKLGITAENFREADVSTAGSFGAGPQLAMD